MRLVLICVIVGVASPAVAQAPVVSSPSWFAVTPEHGGGCRESSPPGQCGHMETATGMVHCH